MFDRFTDRSRKVMNLALREAQKLGHDFLGPEHILLGIVEDGEGGAIAVLERMGVEPARVREEVERIVRTGPALRAAAQLPFTPRARTALDLALHEAERMGHDHIGTEHLLLGLVAEDEGIAAQVLQRLGLGLAPLREQVLAWNAAMPSPRDPVPPARSFPSTSHPRLGIPSERFSGRLEDAWGHALQEAVRLRHDRLRTEHLLAGLLLVEKGVAVHVLHALGIDRARLRRDIETQLGTGRAILDPDRIHVDPGVRVVLALSLDEMRETGHEYLNTGHVLLGLLREEASCASILGAQHITYESARAAVIACLRGIDDDPIWDRIG